MEEIIKEITVKGLMPVQIQEICKSLTRTLSKEDALVQGGIYTEVCETNGEVEVSIQMRYKPAAANGRRFVVKAELADTAVFKPAKPLSHAMSVAILRLGDRSDLVMAIWVEEET